jgi:hypothetical protein
MINILIIYFAQYFQRKINNAMVRISPSTQRSKFWLVFKIIFFFHEQDGWKQNNPQATSPN